MRREKSAGYAMTPAVMEARSMLLSMRSTPSASEADRHMESVLKLVAELEADAAGMKSGGEVTNEQ